MQLLDTAHFPRVVERNHAAAFANQFTNLDYTLRLFSHLSARRNEWAHVLDGQWTEQKHNAVGTSHAGNTDFVAP